MAKRKPAKPEKSAARKKRASPGTSYRALKKKRASGESLTSAEYNKLRADQRIERQQRFLRHFSRSLIVHVAARKAGVALVTVRDWNTTDDAFATQYRAIREAFGEALESAAMKRALYGVPRIKIYQGEIITDADGRPIVERRYPDALTARMLAAHKAIYRLGDDAAEPSATSPLDTAQAQAAMMRATLRGEEPPRGFLPPSWTAIRRIDPQQALLDCSARFKFLPCGRGSGKTTIALRRLVIALATPVDWPDPRYFYGADSAIHAAEIAWDALEDLIPPEWMDGEPEKSAKQFRTKWGALLRIVGFENRNKSRLEGKQWDGGVIDESSDVWPGVVDRIVRPALTDRRGWLWRIGVPKRSGVGATEYREVCETADVALDQACHAWPSSAVVSAEELKHAALTMDPLDYAEQFEASWQTAGGSIFYAYADEVNKRRCSYNADIPLIVGSDFNVDPMAWVICHVYPVDRLLAFLRQVSSEPRLDALEVIDEIHIRDTHTAATLDALYQRYGAHKGGWVFVGDASAQNRSTATSKTDYEIIAADTRFAPPAGVAQHMRTIYAAGNPSLVDRFNWCNALLRNAAGESHAFFDPAARYLIRDLQTRSRKPGTRRPEKDSGHPSDAWGYIVSTLFGDLFRSRADARSVPAVRQMQAATNPKRRR